MLLDGISRHGEGAKQDTTTGEPGRAGCRPGVRRRPGTGCDCQLQKADVQFGGYFIFRGPRALAGGRSFDSTRVPVVDWTAPRSRPKRDRPLARQVPAGEAVGKIGTIWSQNRFRDQNSWGRRDAAGRMREYAEVLKRFIYGLLITTPHGRNHFVRHRGWA